MASNPLKTRYVFLVGDGMADYPLTELGGKTPLEAAHTPNMDRIAGCRIGRVRTIPQGMDPGSDVANLSLLGYDPTMYHTGRGPFEAASMGLKLAPEDVAFRMNLVTLTVKSTKDIWMMSHSSGDISTPEARLLVEDLRKAMEGPEIRMYPGVAYRHILVWKGGPVGARTLPPHDHLDQNVASYLNHGPKDPVPHLIRTSWDLLKEHPVNRERRRRGLPEANSIWLWGQGRALDLPPFRARFGLRGGVISAVDLLKGMGIGAGLEPIWVEGATGYLDTNYVGKGQEAIKALERLDFVFVHVEAPDEVSHQGNVKEKIQAIEAVDRDVLGTLLKGLDRFEDFRIMVASDHYTPIVKRTHSHEPPPYAWASKAELQSGRLGRFSEASALESGAFFDKGHELMAAFVGPG